MSKSTAETFPHAGPSATSVPGEEEAGAGAEAAATTPRRLRCGSCIAADRGLGRRSGRRGGAWEAGGLPDEGASCRAMACSALVGLAAGLGEEERAERRRLGGGRVVAGREEAVEASRRRRELPRHGLLGSGGARRGARAQGSWLRRRGARVEWMMSGPVDAVRSC
nr:unnamed protein product [Digitaria exilis]